MFVGAEDVEQRIGKLRFHQLFDHDSDGIADNDKVNTACVDANREVQSILIGKGFSDDQLKLAAADETLRRQAAWIAAEHGAMQKPELLNEQGQSFYTPLAAMARKILGQVATAERRLSAENVAGKSAAVTGRVIVTEPEFFVAPSARNPKGPGGF